MLKYCSCAFFAVLFIAFTGLTVAAQIRDPEAYLRVSAPSTDDDHFYYVEIYMPLQLKEEEFKKLQVKPDNRLIFLALKGQQLGYRLEVSPADCTMDAAGKPVCSRTHFRIYLPKSIDLTKSYQISFDGYPLNDGNNQRFPNVSVSVEYSASINKGDKLDLTCQYKMLLIVSYDDDSNPDVQKRSPLRFLTEQDKTQYSSYVTARLTALNDWFMGLNRAGLDSVELRVRPLNTLIHPPAALHAREIVLGTWKLPNGDTWEPSEGDLPLLKVARLGPTPDLQKRMIVACVDTEKHLPTEDFNVKLTVKNLDRPTELQRPMIKTGLAGNPVQAAATKLDDTSKVGARTIERDLDIAFGFSSSVDEKQKPNPDPSITTPITVHERTTRGTWDLRVAPLGIRQYWAKTAETEDGRTSGHYLLWTRFFIDSKVSTGKIVKDTLSLNRTVLGTQGEYQYIYRNGLFPTYYRFIGRFSSASDRDFKQAEYKGTIEFRPVLSFLNHPQASLQAAQPQVIQDPSKSETQLTFISPKRGGYEFVPIFGAEIGQTYRHHNPASAIQPVDPVKRAYAGADITFTPINRTTFSATDIFYWNRGLEKKPRANYLNASVSFLLGNLLDYSKAGHSVFVSFERGQQPPFDGPGANVVKFGYRIQGDGIFKKQGGK